MGLRDLLGGKGKGKGGKVPSGQAKSDSNSSGSVVSQTPASVGASASSAMSDGLQQQIDAVSQGGVLTLDISRGEYEGPIVVSHPMTIDGQGRSIWCKKGPVISVESDGVVLNNLEIEVTGNEKKLSDDEACALAVNPGVQVGLNDIVVRGHVVGVAEEEGIWRYPRSLRIGTVKANQAHEFTLRIAVPIPCRLKSEIAGMNVSPTSIRNSGVTDLTLKVDALSPGTRLRGSMLMQTAFLTRRIMVGGNVARDPNQKAVEDGKVLWEPDDAGAIPKLSSLTVSPSDATVEIGGQTQFSVNGVGENGEDVPVPQVSWQADGGQVDTQGLFTAGSNAGSFTVTAASGGLTGSATVSIAEPRKLSRLDISPAGLELVPGKTQRFTLKAFDENSQQMPAPAVKWSASGGQINQSGVFTAAGAEGQFKITAAAGGVSSSASVTVRESPKLTRMEISPKNATLTVGQAQTFTVKGFDQHDNAMAISKVTWSASGGKIANDGRFVAGDAEETITVWAAVASLKASASVRVQKVRRVARIEIRPQKKTIQPGKPIRIEITGYDGEGAKAPVGKVQWTASAGSISDDGVLLAPSAPGRIDISARADALRATCTVTVEESSLTNADGPWNNLKATETEPDETSPDAGDDQKVGGAFPFAAATGSSSPRPDKRPEPARPKTRRAAKSHDSDVSSPHQEEPEAEKTTTKPAAGKTGKLAKKSADKAPKSKEQEPKPKPKKLSRVKTNGLGGAWGS